LMLFYIYSPSLPKFNTWRTLADRARLSVFTAEHWIQMSGRFCSQQRQPGFLMHIFPKCPWLLRSDSQPIPGLSTIFRTGAAIYTAVVLARSTGRW
jgi:hypothetical protein